MPDVFTVFLNKDEDDDDIRVTPLPPGEGGDTNVMKLFVKFGFIYSSS